jgi:L-seryl-tRNA(Ser) seleniumtransferase
VRELDSTVAAVLWRPEKAGDMLPLALVVQLCREVAVPVIVDAAMYVPPLDRLHAILAAGADLVAISGGKGFRGPHTSGLLCGRSDLVRAAALHHLDMDVRDQTWSPSEVSGLSAPRGRHGIARGMKVGREQVVGLAEAVAEYTADPGGHETRYDDELSSLEDALRSAPGLRAHRRRNHHLDVPETVIELADTGCRADAVIRALDAGKPRIHVGEDEAWQDVITINPMGLHRGEGRQIGARVVAIVQSSAGPVAGE